LPKHLKVPRLPLAGALLPESSSKNGVIRFATFDLDLRSGELRKCGVRLKLSGQPFQVLTILAERPGEVVTRDELQKILWPDTFVDVDHNLNAAVNRIREVLGDSAESPRFVETLPRRGYRFIAPLNGNGRAGVPAMSPSNRPETKAGELPANRTWHRSYLVLALSAMAVVALPALMVYKRYEPFSPAERGLTRLTFDEGLQFGATWSPDGRFIAYSSDRGGKLGIWIQQLGVGDPFEIAKGPGDKWMPNWSPDGKYIAYRSEDGEGGLFVVLAFGGDGPGRKISSFGYRPFWSPDGSQILFQTTQSPVANGFYVVGLDGSPPHQVLTDLTNEQFAVSAAWHPDGKRISIWTCADFNIWTQPIAGGPAIKSEMSAEVLREVKQLSLGAGLPETTNTYFFTWAPSGKAVYLELTFRGAKDLWRMEVNPETLQALSLKRVTTASNGTELALSRDGEKLAFSSETGQVRAWTFPFDANGGRLKGPGKPVTPSGRQVWQFTLSRDGKKLAYRADRPGKQELWQTSLDNGQESIIAGDDFSFRSLPLWSPDGTRLAYFRKRASTEKEQIIIWSALTGEETPITEPKGDKTTSPKYRNAPALQPYDWSTDGRSLLISQLNHDNQRWEIWAVDITSAQSAGKIASSPEYDLWQGHFSPDGRWILFGANRGAESTIFLISAAGGPWIPVTDGKQWDDKPRWSPDGKTIYFVSGRNGFYNVYGVRFDPARRKTFGSPFRVTDFRSTAAMIPKGIIGVDLGISQDRLVVNVEQLSGNIWVLDHMDR
jgi:Tol biopolymer transport system component/DNA-binding winged helix-turn-helix (wHTH) protein